MQDHDGGPIAWREHGPADAEAVVVLLHGLGGTRTAWQPQLRALGQAGWRAVAWDMPGYGESPAPAGRLGFPLLADAVVMLLDELGVERADLVGLSMGGMIALHAAHRTPERVRTLSLVDTSPKFGLDGTTSAQQWVAARLAPLHAGETPATMAHRVIRSVMAPTAPAAAVAEACAAMSRISPAGLEAAVRCLPEHDLAAELGRITTPAVVVVGEHDRETPPTYAKYLADHLARARLVVLPGVGHLSNLEAPDALNELLLDFLERQRSL